MKRELTITVNSELLLKAKEYARPRKISLASSIEDWPRRLTLEEWPSFAAGRKGRFRPARRDEPRYRALTRKYLDAS